MKIPASLPGALPATPSISTALAQVRQRLREPWSTSGEALPAQEEAAVHTSLPMPAPRRALALQASLSEFWLLLRLRMRPRTEHSSELTQVIQRALHIVWVTSQDWFGAAAPGRR